MGGTIVARQRLGWGQYLLGLLILAAGLAAAGLLHSVIGQYERAARLADLEVEIDQDVRRLQRGVDGYLASVAGLIETLSLAPELDRGVFRQSASDVLRRYPGARVLAWVPRITGVERSSVEARMQSAVPGGARIWELGEDGRPTASADRAEYFPVLLSTDEFTGDQLGFDLASHPKRRSMLDAARDLAIPLVVGRARVDVSGRPTQAVRIAFPVFAAHADLVSFEERRAALLGYLVMLLRVPDMLAQIRPPDRHALIELTVVDPMAPPLDQTIGVPPLPADAADSVTVVSPQTAPGSAPAPGPLPTDATGAAGRQAMSRLVEFGGERWTVVLTPTPSHPVNGVPIVASLSALVVAALTVAVFVHLMGVFRRSRETEWLVAERTRELAATNAALVREIAERRDAEAQLQVAKSQAESANSAKTQFLANISHELRTPLNAIIGFSDIILRQSSGPLNVPQFREYLADIHDSAKHLLDLINDLLELSKIDAQRTELNEEEVSLAEILRACSRMLSNRAQAGQVTLDVDCPPELPSLVADERALRQVMLNLMANAVKFTPAGGRVHAEARLRGDGGIDIAVRDTGIGIAKADLPRVFEPFWQADSSLGRKYQGTGLGLPLAKRLIELHRGALTLDSEPGQGTTVTVSLPADRVVRLPFARVAG